MLFKLVTVFYLLAVVTTTPSDHVRKYRMIGGSKVEPHEFPHMVTLIDEDLFHFYGGAILDENWVITAAHCIWFVPEGQSFRIEAGEHSFETVEGTEQVINVTKFFVYEKYPGGLRAAAHDIALIKLEKPLVLNEFVKPISLPEMNSQVDGEVVLSGWAQVENEECPDKPQKVRMTIVDLDTCKQADELLTEEQTIITDMMLCTMSSNNNPHSCRGDSGYPLIKHEGDKSVIVGIVSWGFRCDTDGAPAIYTKVSSYIDWIKNVMANN